MAKSSRCSLVTTALVVLALHACGDHKKPGGSTDSAAPDGQPDLGAVADTIPPPEPPTGPDAVGPAGDAGAPAGARLTVEPASLNFGTVDPGTGVYIEFRIKNVGTGVSGSLTITPGPDLSTEQSSRSALLPGEQTSFLVTVTTTTEGTIDSWIAVAADPGATPAVRASVSGVFAPWGPFMVSPRVIDLGTVPYGSELLRTITVTMRESVTDLTMKTTGSFATIDPGTTCTAKMDSGTTCEVAVRFVVSQAGTVSDGVMITATGSRRKTSVVNIRAVADTSG